MTYQVLARKWRPKSFAELMGQEHVVRALSGGLEQGRLHHAFLFTGTRGVGKTTIARIISKAMNCEVGISATPCGQCSTCLDIDAGRYPDLMEIDAASRTKVDDTRDLLDNVIYAPARGRFKVYLIDEVHMLSINSFNALLKTLEEPPPHVKFLLATTDPQKLPITVLSRCLKFHLKRLSLHQIETQMHKILAAESIAYELEAVAEIARAADGSMRDGLSLLDQAIAFGGGSVQTVATLEMLGTVSVHSVTELLEAIASRSTSKLTDALAQISSMGGNYPQVLARVAEQLHQIAFLQLGDAPSDEDVLSKRLWHLAEQFDPEEVQLKFQFALLGAKDTQTAHDPRIAFEMCMLRMMAFTEPGVAQPPTGSTGRDGQQVAGVISRVKADAASTSEAALPMPAQTKAFAAAAPVSAKQVNLLTADQPSEALFASPVDVSGSETSPMHQRWHALSNRLDLASGPARELARNAVVKHIDEEKLSLRIDPSFDLLASAENQAMLIGAIKSAEPGFIDVQLVLEKADLQCSPRSIDQQKNAALQSEFEQNLSTDPLVSALIEQFSAGIVPGSAVANTQTHH